MSNVKGKGQRLIPEELLKYLESLKANHSDPSAEWGSSGTGGLLEDIKDSNGNYRFIDGEITYLNPSYSGVVIKSPYHKFSLSGTHLMIVGVLKNDTSSQASIGTDIKIFEVELPTWIFNKIVPLNETNGFLDRHQNYASDGSSTVWNRLYKDSESNKLYITQQSSIAANTSVRFQFDLLIDSE